MATFLIKEVFKRDEQETANLFDVMDFKCIFFYLKESGSFDLHAGHCVYKLEKFPTKLKASGGSLSVCLLETLFVLRDMSDML